MKKALMIGASLVGLVFLYAAFLYWTTPVNALPAYFPGFDPALTGIHFKHGLAAFVVAVAVFVFAWFESGPRKTR